MPAPDLEELAARLTPGSYAAGELVHRRYDEARTVELVESGRVRLSIGTHAGEKVLGVAGPGELFGERALIDGELRATDAVVIEGCRLLSIPAADLLRFIESRPAIAERTLTAVRVRLRQESELTREPEPENWRRLVIEKPFGRDLTSARALNETLRTYCREDQLYRIDHYLGKETVQNLLVFRFANILFEPLWNSNYIEHVQISVEEKVAMEGRGDYYDRAGVLRDMFQNHLLQLIRIDHRARRWIGV